MRGRLQGISANPCMATRPYGERRSPQAGCGEMSVQVVVSHQLASGLRDRAGQ
jgi:hypothetical protein